jgi:hypothetical protein
VVANAVTKSIIADMQALIKTALIVDLNVVVKHILIYVLCF